MTIDTKKTNVSSVVQFRYSYPYEGTLLRFTGKRSLHYPDLII